MRHKEYVLQKLPRKGTVCRSLMRIIPKLTVIPTGSASRGSFPRGGPTQKGVYSMENKKPLDKRLVAVIVGLVLIIMAMAFFLLFRKDDPATINDGDTPRIGYATEAKVMLDQNSLQAAMDEAMKNAQDGNVALRYKNNAYSTNGTDFECFIVNSASNKYDMFLTIYADAEMTDQVFLSGLVPPGSGFENITLDKALDPGDHEVVVVVTQVDTDENGEQVIKHQVAHTMDFHVTE